MSGRSCVVRLRRPLVLRGRRQDGAKLCRVGGGGPNRGLSRPRLSSWLIIPSVFCFLLGGGAFVWLYLQMSWSSDPFDCCSSGWCCGEPWTAGLWRDHGCIDSKWPVDRTYVPYNELHASKPLTALRHGNATGNAPGNATETNRNQAAAWSSFNPPDPRRF